MTEKHTPYRAEPHVALTPRLAQPVGTGATQLGDLTFMRSAEALRVGDGWLVTVYDGYFAMNPYAPTVPPIMRPYARFPSSMLGPSPTQTTTTFFTTMSLDAIRDALFFEVPATAEGG